MANSVYDPRNERLWYVSVIEEETRARLGRMPCYVNMTSTLGNRVVAVRKDGIRMCRATDGREYTVREADVYLSVARQFGFNMTPAEIADGLINAIADIPHLNALFRYEREWRDLWRRLNQHPTAVQPPEFKTIKYTEYDRVMKAYAERKRAIEQGR